MLLDGNKEAFEAYLSGDRRSEIVLEYFRRHEVARPIGLVSPISPTSAMRP
jgi:hypothetical protein